MELKERIIQEATELFFRKGIRAVTMNDVAEALGISKRTLYEHFSNKEELLKQCLLGHYHTHRKKIEQLEDEAANPVDIMHRHFRYHVIRINDYHPGFVSELQKFHPDIWNNLVADLLEDREKYTMQLISEGISQGYFREDIDPGIASKLLFSHVDLLSDTETFPTDRISRSDLFRQILTGFLRGLSTEKGFKEVENLFYNDKQEDYV